jgi:hypothetical protein
MSDPVTTIFPVLLDGKVHAAFVMDHWTDSWATQCGKQVPDGSAVEHKIQTVECRGCAQNIERAWKLRESMRKEKA